MSLVQKIRELLSPGQSRAAVILVLLMLIGTVLETLGIGLVIPALALMVQGDIGAKYPALVPWLERFGNPGREQLIVAGMLTLVGIYAIKALYLAFLAWRQAHFIFMLQSDLSRRLFAGYLRQPYTFHLQRNSAQLIHNAFALVNEIAGVLQSGMMLLAEVLVLAGISILLLAVEPLGAILVIVTLGAAGWGFNRLTSRRIARWGEARQYHEGQRLQRLQQGLGGAKDVKLLGREQDFIAQYELHNEGSARVGKRQVTLQPLPRLWLELLAISGLAALVLTMIGQGKPLESLLPTLGLFAAAAFRVMPSVSRILTSLQNVRYHAPAIKVIHAEFGTIEEAKASSGGRPLKLDRELTMDQVVFSYPGAGAPALRGITLSIVRGSSVGFIGGSGAGKSTLVDVILGLLAPEGGTVRVDGTDIQDNLRGWQDQIGYVPQSIYLTDDTLRSNIAFGIAAEKIDDQAVWKAIRAAQLEQFVSSQPQGLDTLVGERGVRLSGGQRQRIGIARALYHDPAVLVLDEATSSLDVATEHGVMEAVRALKGEKTIIIVAHRLSTVERCDRLYRLEQGRVVDEGDAVVVLGRTGMETHGPQ